MGKERPTEVSATADLSATKQEFVRLRLPITPPFAPMEARTASEIPTESDWIYEPKWDGFRCIAFREQSKVELQSKAGQPLTRYFPELVRELLQVKAERFVLDAEIVIETNQRLDFNALLQRVHPAESRVQRLSKATPAMLLCFDLLVDADGKSLVREPLFKRKTSLEMFFQKHVPTSLKKSVCLSPSSKEPQQALGWLTELAAYGCDGIIAKLKDEPYHSGDRDAMVKVKRIRTADCVIGGFRHAQKKEQGVGSVLLGLYDDFGDLNHVGYSSSFAAIDKKDLLKKLQSVAGPPGFTGKAPGGPSRWTRAQERSTEWEPVKPVLVCEVQYDHFSGGRFRHGTKFLRWRPEKAPKSCTYEQLEVPATKVKPPRRKAS
ncbi:MAG TPA: ATP-dependent DNA ligase [Terriglobales bacterium]|nr:ATP-dependent DNA ligase [Terriglobales bacterium]